MKVASIVEGHGEVHALPVLLRRLSQWRTPDTVCEVLPPIRVRRDRFLNREEEFHRNLQLAAAKCDNWGWVLVLLDADDDCPAEVAVRIRKRAELCVPHRRVSVVLAKREYEAWFIAAAESLYGHRGFTVHAEDLIDAEISRDAKGWIRARMASGSYGETTDQPALSALMDLQQAFDRSRSFRKLCGEWDKQATVTE